MPQRIDWCKQYKLERLGIIISTVNFVSQLIVLLLLVAPSTTTSKSTIGVDHAIRDQPCPCCPHCYSHLHHVHNHLGDWTSSEKENSMSTINQFFCVNLFVRNGIWEDQKCFYLNILPVLLQAGSLLSGPLHNMFGMRGMFLLVSSVLMVTTLGYLLLYYAVLKRLFWTDSFNMIELFVGS